MSNHMGPKFTFERKILDLFVNIFLNKSYDNHTSILKRVRDFLAAASK